MTKAPRPVPRWQNVKEDRCPLCGRRLLVDADGGAQCAGYGSVVMPCDFWATPEERRQILDELESRRIDPYGRRIGK